MGKKKGKLCPRCKGTGRHIVEEPVGNPYFLITLRPVDGGKCSYCGGKGRVDR